MGSQPVVLGAVKMLLLLLLPFSALAYSPDQDLVGDIFGTQQVQEEVGDLRSIEQETRCDDLRPCVECSVFRQYWKHFSSAYECYESCKQYSFVYQPVADTYPNGWGILTYPEGWTYEGSFEDGKFDGHGKFTWGPDNYFEGEFKNGEMTGNGVYYTAEGGLYDSSVGLYYPNSGDKSEFYEA